MHVVSSYTAMKQFVKSDHGVLDGENTQKGRIVFISSMAQCYIGYIRVNEHTINALTVCCNLLCAL